MDMGRGKGGVFSWMVVIIGEVSCGLWLFGDLYNSFVMKFIKYNDK